MDDLQFAVQWFNDNVIALNGVKGVSVTYTQEGHVLLLVTEEDETHYWLTALWTNYLGETGYERFPRKTKWMSTRPRFVIVKQKPWWKFWG